MTAGTAGAAGTRLEFDSARLRAVLGNFCTGVTVITAHDGERPAGFACQSFAALSLDPPLVLFCPARTSRSWPAIERAGRFAVNVLAEDQREVSSVFGSRGADKFESVRWHRAASGVPLLDGALAWIDCTVDAVHEAGDHLVVVGRVTALDDTRATSPLLFFRGAYTAPADPHPSAMLTWPRPDDWF